MEVVWSVETYQFGKNLEQPETLDTWYYKTHEQALDVSSKNSDLARAEKARALQKAQYQHLVALGHTERDIEKQPFAHTATPQFPQIVRQWRLVESDAQGANTVTRPAATRTKFFTNKSAGGS